MSVDSVKNKLGFFITEVDRVLRYNQIYNALNSYNTNQYNQEDINRLNNLYSEVESSFQSYGEDGHIDYSEQYYSNVRQTLGGILGQTFNSGISNGNVGTDFRIDQSLNSGLNPTQIIQNRIESVRNSIMSQLNGQEEVTVSNGINPDEYNPSRNPLTAEDSQKVTSKIGVILGSVRNISIVVSVIILMIIGVKYILGSAEEKANYKATILPYIIGCIMSVAGTTIVSFIYNMVK